MIRISDKKDCCGCAACVQRCPKYCISLEEDTEGFLYPKVDTKNCINCGLCEKVCPWQNRLERKPLMKVLAVKNHNEVERMASSSGGVFIALAKEVLSKGGVVFGAAFDENWEVRHTYAETLEAVKPMMGSKYLQSRIENSYQDAEEFLKEGRHVLFTGTPCQIAGLHRFLRKEYPNLLSVDILCHGVPSPGVWRRYLHEEFDIPSKGDISARKSDPSKPIITDIEFRDKTMHGWRDFCFIVRGNTSRSGTMSVLLSDTHNENPFMRGFLSDVYLRPSCYQCKCKNGISHSDLTIADYWAIDLSMPDFNDDKGIGLVLVNTEKGKDVFDRLDMEIRSSNLADAKPMNGGFNERVLEHPKRNLFFERLHRGDAMKVAIEKTLYIPVYRRFWIRIKNKIKRILY